MIREVDIESLREAGELIREGRLVAFPTETVYGLGARADDEEAVARIYSAKGRPPENPSIVHAVDARRAFDLVSEVSPFAEELAARFWPGPLTLVMKARPGSVAHAVTAGGSTVALRVPAHRVARELLRVAGVPIAAPSANRSTSISPTTAAHVQKSLGDRVDMILDGGATGFGIESTIVDVSGDTVRLLRRGSISLPNLRALGREVLDVSHSVTREGERAVAPGSQFRHYAPDTRLELVFEGELAEAIESARTKGLRIGALLRARARSLPPIDVTMVLSDHPEAYATGLYAALHALDEARCDILLVEAPPEGDAWDAVRDRLLRASRPW